MNIRLSKKFILMLLLCLFLSGCNMFEAVDTTLQTKSADERIAEGEIALDKADYLKAEEIFSKLQREYPNDNDALRGLGDTFAGMGGFNLFSALNVLQDGSGPYDRTNVIFKLNTLPIQEETLKRAISLLSTDIFPSQADRITRALINLELVARLLVAKYDTNHNHKIDNYDEIEFSTNDQTTPDWSTLRKDILYGPASSGMTLEQSFMDLFYGFNGKGASWTFITPITKQTITGQFTEINKATILAVGDLTQELRKADSYYGIDLASFSTVLRNLDGAD
ncbi:MAG: hypothetical protein HQM08_04705 [Candidatus Riflebacteria bacterium]|nr:hypothetical protein [Candidatus Riflebacteria bacterium]